jgi:hypothetical protein
MVVSAAVVGADWWFHRKGAPAKPAPSSGFVGKENKSVTAKGNTFQGGAEFVGNETVDLKDNVFGSPAESTD